MKGSIFFPQTFVRADNGSLSPIICLHGLVILSRSSVLSWNYLFFGDQIVEEGKVEIKISGK